MNDKTLAGFSKESPAPRYVVYHLAGGYRRKQKWHVCDSADLRHTNPPPVIAVCYEEEHAERIIEALNESFSPETPACAVVMAAEALLEVLPVPNDYYGDEAQALREALDNAPAETGVSADSRDAARWRAFVRSTGHEVDMSTGPGKNKDLHIRINCTGCERYFESGAPDYEGTLNATMDDEIKLQANELKAGDGQEESS